MQTFEKTIWKYILQKTDLQTFDMPVGSEILTVQMQGDNICMWALVTKSESKEKRHFEIFGTGHPVNCKIGTSRKYISTFQMNDGSLIFHVFEYTGR